MTLFKKRSLFLFLLSFSVALSSTAQEKKFSIEVGPEYRNTDFRWNIAGNMQGQNPNVLSELIFKPINAAGIHTKVEYNIIDNFSMNAHYDRLWTYTGSVTDFDYDGDNRTNPTTELYLQSNKGHARSVGVNFDYHFFRKNDFTATGGVGLDFTKELFYLTNDNDPLLQSTYEAQWNGPNATLKGLYQPKGIFNIGAGLTYRYLIYDAKANWNLVETFQHPVSFTHDAKGHGLDYRVSFGIKPKDFLNIALDGLYSNWETGYGTDKLFQTDGQIIKARMNGAFKKSFGLRLTTTFSF